jgi:hypothetical protein
MLDFIDWQDTWMDMAKKQASSVIVTTTALGAITFDIPNFAKKSRRKDRLRKDSYTTMMLANWGLKCYLEMENFSTDVEVESFTPFFM